MLNNDAIFINKQELLREQGYLFISIFIQQCNLKSSNFFS